MSTTVFPAGLTVRFNELTMEEMTFYTRAWSLQHKQMQKGLFVGSVIATHTPRMQLMRGPYSHGVLIQGDFPAGTILIAFVLTDADVVFQNKILDKHEIKILRSGDEIDFLCNGASETFTIVVQEQFFYEAYVEYFGVDFSTHTKDKLVYVDPQFFFHFTRGLEKWINYLMQDHTLLKIEDNYEEVESNILDHIFSCIYMEETQKGKEKTQSIKIRDFLHQSIDNPITIKYLSEEIKISKRSLHHAFKLNYGYTPKRYLLNLRMHQIRQELLLADPLKKTVSEIAQRYHFFYPNTFSAAYKNMFGEVPSQTLENSLRTI